MTHFPETKKNYIKELKNKPTGLKIWKETTQSKVINI